MPEVGRAQIALDIWANQEIEKSPKKEEEIREVVKTLQWEAIAPLSEQSKLPRPVQQLSNRQFRMFKIKAYDLLPAHLSYLIKGVQAINNAVQGQHYNLWRTHMEREVEQCLCCFVAVQHHYTLYGGWRADEDGDELEMFSDKGTCCSGAITPLECALVRI